MELAYAVCDGGGTDDTVEILERYGDRPYILFVSTLETRKNLVRLI